MGLESTLRVLGSWTTSPDAGYCTGVKVLVKVPQRKKSVTDVLGGDKSEWARLAQRKVACGDTSVSDFVPARLSTSENSECSSHTALVVVLSYAEVRGNMYVILYRMRYQTPEMTELSERTQDAR
jgi:hypothetical protein